MRPSAHHLAHAFTQAKDERSFHVFYMLCESSFGVSLDSARCPSRRVGGRGSRVLPCPATRSPSPSPSRSCSPMPCPIAHRRISRPRPPHRLSLPQPAGRRDHCRWPRRHRGVQRHDLGNGGPRLRAGARSPLIAMDCYGLPRTATVQGPLAPVCHGMPRDRRRVPLILSLAEIDDTF